MEDETSEGMDTARRVMGEAGDRMEQVPIAEFTGGTLTLTLTLNLSCIHLGDETLSR